MWNKLSMADRAKYIQLGVQSGVTDLNTIRKHYNTYAEGGYLDWIDNVKKWRPGIEEDIDSEEPTYDYEGFFHDNPEYAWNMLHGDPKAHFTDKYKRPNHPTFSDESIYSTLETPGGHWHENYGGGKRWVYEPSEYTRKNLDKTREYLENSGEGYLDGANVVFPKRYKAFGGNLYSGKEPHSQQMNINYYNPITGKSYGKTKPDNMVIVNSFDQLTPEAQDEYQSNHPVDLPELIVTSRPSLRDTMSGIFSKKNFDDHKGELKEVLSYFPVVGDGIDLYDFGNHLTRGNYKEAAFAGLGLLLPEAVEKGGKFLKNLFIDAAQTKLGAQLMDKTFNRKAVKKAKKEGRYIPDMSTEQYKEYIRLLQESYNKQVIPGTTQRYNKRLSIFEDKYLNLSDKSDELSKIPIEFSNTRGLRGRRILDRDELGVYLPDKNRLYVSLQDPLSINILRPFSETNGIASHELEHKAQELLGMDKLLQLNPTYQTILGYNPTEIIERLPVSKFGFPKDKTGKVIGDGYYGIPEEAITHGSSVFTNPKNGYLFESEGVFNHLLDNNVNYTWESSPFELMSEAANYIVRSEPNSGKLFSELSEINKDRLSKKLSERFDVDENDMRTMLDEGSIKGYFRFGGKLENKEK